jgi:hypothetical protein
MAKGMGTTSRDDPRSEDAAGGATVAAQESRRRQDFSQLEEF